MTTLTTYQNRLLARLGANDLALLQPHLEPVDLPVGLVVIEPDQPITHAVFPETGLCSVIANLQERNSVEVGLFGRDGFVGTALVLGSTRVPHQTFMQVSGTGLRIEAEALTRAIEASPSLRRLLLRYIQTFLIQTAQTALANASAPAEERLARWLAMYHDRQDGDELSVTHEFLSLMLGVRRPTITVALQMLEGAGLVRAQRGRVRVLNRAGLIAAAGPAYGPAEAEYDRLIGPLHGHGEAERTDHAIDYSSAS
ncbi:CarD family transcriptional regulator [Methylobacterium sp. Leaf456]|uniref:Crp/Fnr family transcriptional regulator n=1 Tax=Methylobacterium sp. Leaf456 TaxID=1736382 RepID=UPI0006F5BED0|nr:Crp/Fnr family transcriptional regulator [Methylobacterium sp. Leaf456]KQT46520.1 CarD family transcriptional regulator [Methylobacterium sp. Leaf456]